MPGMSELEVARELMVIRTNLPMLVTSGFIDELTARAANEAATWKVFFKGRRSFHIKARIVSMFA